MKPHVLWLCLIGLIVRSCLATAIAVSSDGRVIAVASDSKRRGEALPVCKIRRITGGVFFAAGETIAVIGTRDKPWVFDTFERGVEAADSLSSCQPMIDRFTEQNETGLRVLATFERNNVADALLKWNYGVPLLQVGYALFVNGRPSYCVRSFYPIVKGSDDITFRHGTKCPVRREVTPCSETLRWKDGSELIHPCSIRVPSILLLCWSSVP